MKLSFRPKLMQPTTSGMMLPNERPMADPARPPTMPPSTKPAVLAISPVGVISTTATPSSADTSAIPSHFHAGEDTCTLLTALALRDRHTCRGRARDQPPAVVEHVRLAEEQGLAHLDHPPDGPQPALDRGTQEVDLELDRGVPQPVFLERGERRTHRRVGDLCDHAALDD